jgi:hypothetical protein
MKLDPLVARLPLSNSTKFASSVADDDPCSVGVADERATELAPVPLRLDFARNRGTRRRCDLDGPLVVAHHLSLLVLIRRPG